MSKPFLPHADAPVNGSFSADSARLPLPGSRPDAIRIAWESGSGYILFGDASVDVSAADGIRLPATTGVEILRVPPAATHIAYMGCAINLVAGDGL